MKHALLPRLAFGLYVVVHAVHAVAHRGRHRPLPEVAP